LVFNKRLNPKPAEFIAPNTESEVCEAVQAWAAANARSCSGVSVLSGGHHYEGWSALGSVLNMARFKGLRMDLVERTLEVEAGVVFRELWDFFRMNPGFWIPTVDCESVSVVGATLCGGINIFQRKLGLMCDSVRSFRIALPSGEIRTVRPVGGDAVGDRAASEDSVATDADIFWALSGGGGSSFGAVVSATFELQLRVAVLTAVTIEWPLGAESFAQVFQAWCTWAPIDASRHLGLELNLRPGPAVTGTGIFLGDEAALRKLLAESPLPTALAVKARQLAVENVWEEFDFNDDVSARWKNAGMVLRQPLDDAAVHRLATLLANPPASSAEDADHGSTSRDLAGAAAVRGIEVTVSCMPLGGAVADVAADATAFPHRSHTFTMQVIARWGSPRDDDGACAWVDEVQRVIAGPDGRSADFYCGWADASIPRPQALVSYFGGNLPKLVQVKQRVDPMDIFRHPHSIPTSPLPP
jgi:FAD/FMN-containing dehydrogenase